MGRSVLGEGIAMDVPLNNGGLDVECSQLAGSRCPLAGILGLTPGLDVVSDREPLAGSRADAAAVERLRP